MSRDITPNEFRRIFPNATASAARRNQDCGDGNRPPNTVQELQAGVKWNPENVKWLQDNYPRFGRNRCAEVLNMTPSAIRTKASRLGLRFIYDEESRQAVRDKISKAMQGVPLSPEHRAAALAGRKRLAESGWKHPPLTQEQRQNVSAALRERSRIRKLSPELQSAYEENMNRKVWQNYSVNLKRSDTMKKRWGNKSAAWHTEATKQKQSDAQSKRASTRTAEQTFSNRKAGHRKDIGIYVRSSWEANYARYLNFLMLSGEIGSWKYEPETFWFDAIKRGCRSYKPDFRVTMPNGSIEYHEVKGWMYPRARTALRRMAKYHPAIRIVLIDEKRYKSLKRTVGGFIKNWE